MCVLATVVSTPLPRGPVIMVVVAIATLLILKIVTLIGYLRSSHRKPTPIESLAWIVAWPGLNAGQFFEQRQGPPPTLGEWSAAAFKMVLGAVLFFGVAPRLESYTVPVRAWIAMTGLVLLLHFGGLHLSALLWRRAGRNVQPIMNAPIRSTSLSEFWSERWNLAFRDFAKSFVMNPLARRTNARIAVWGCFLFSGLIHELAISVPAGGGYGLPTAYFLLQALGGSLQRTPVARRLGLNHGVRGWIFTFLFLVPGAYWLFHPPFVHNVILPLIGGAS